MSAPEILEAKESDLPEIAALVNSAYRGESSRAGWTTEADYLDGQRTDAELLARAIEEGRKILSLRENGALLGCVSLTRREGETRSCYLGMLTIRPELQARGLGKILLAHSEERARQWGAERMVIDVIHLRSELIAWYKRHGYRETGKTSPFPYGDPRLGLPRREDLHFVELEKPLSRPGY